jgi:ABC-type uncharacterized transport system permease subunit
MTIRRHVGLYFHLAAQYFKARMSYRGDFIVAVLGTFFWWLPSFFSVVVIFVNIPSLAGYSLEELVFIYGFYMLAMTPNGICFGNAWQLPRQVRSGDFIKYYFRPVNMMFYFMSESIDVGSLYGVPLSIGLIAWSSIRLGLAWNAVKLIGAIVLFFSASLIVDALMVAAAATAFWLTNSHSLLQLISRFRDNSRYPLTIYNDAFRLVFSIILPIGFVAFYPVQWILRPGEAGIAPFLTPVVGIVSFALTCLLWHRGTRRWSGTGT